ncbi:hypothetical protein [Cognatishimia maritima]|uniref:Uncharacterized protein n=1 Tax=Cognatishimia maritima TaxID=870908 RepID=A0A1M5MIN0_9RHOB|nr:hypothetical protein [Cognatishimia maritima]SHG77230.1 hypothetical protein SAMN04488044_1248 [Cognatishimia maritima]
MESGFFKWLWRYNAFAIAGAATVTIVVLGLIAFELYQDATRDVYVSNVVNTDTEDQTLIETYTYGRLQVVDNDNGPALVAPLYTEQSYSLIRNSKSTSRNTVNYKMIWRDGRQEWLFKDFSQLIVDENRARRPINGDEKQMQVVAVFLTVVPMDTNDDQRLSGRDKKQLYVTTADYQEKKLLLEDIQGIEFVENWGEDVVLVKAEIDKDFRLFEYQISDGSWSKLTTLTDH